ncbi:MAG: hypothetical protein M1828_000606 [Chrysothrix sp. TS-e1954]|nr:MAG: hypothetical protein M1828_000606 [Chrysothrix sp. TS-e1954]
MATSNVPASIPNAEPTAPPATHVSPYNEKDIEGEAEDAEPSSPYSAEGKDEQTSEPIARKQTNEDTHVYPSFKKTCTIMAALFLCMFMMALDQMILATAIPRITDEFDSFNDIGWYASAYMLTSAALQLFWGRVYTFYSPKWVFLSLMVLFEAGSAICGAAPSSPVLIFGRALAGAGAAGIQNGAVVIVTDVVPLHNRPKWMGIFGMTFGIASVLGPLLGGVFTDSSATWRWCFYINLPIGAVAMVVVFFFVTPPPTKNEGTPWKQQINQLDPIGTSILVAAVVCLVLAFQWGGTKYSWDSGRIIALFVVSGILFIAFIGIQLWRKEKATLPLRLVKNRTIAFGFLFITTVGSGITVAQYYIPIWFQAIRGTSAVHSGIDNLPFLLGLVISTLGAGFAVSKVGYYVPFMIASSILTSIGAGLLTTFTPSTMHPKWIGVQALYGIGIGLAMQAPSVAAQTVLQRKDIPTGISLMFFGRTLGGAIFASVGQTVVNNRLSSGLSKIPGFDASAIVDGGATNVRQIVSGPMLQRVLVVYNNAITHVFYICVAMAVLSAVGAAGMEWKSVRKNMKKDQQKQEK